MFHFSVTPLACLLVLLEATVCYLLGCINGAVLASRHFYQDDVRSHGSGNAGLTNFCRSYGAKRALCVVAVDMGKLFLSVAFFALIHRIFSYGNITVKEIYFSGLFCVLGHIFPVTAHFRGGKGVLCSAALLLCLDWRIALVGWGLFLLLTVTTRYVSLGSVCSALSFPIATAFVYRSAVLTTVAFALALLVLWAHRENIRRLLHGEERRLHFGCGTPEP